MKAAADIDEYMLDQAIAWQQALELSDADWDGYTRWLETDPRHRRAVDEVALIDRIVSERAADVNALENIRSHPQVSVTGWRRRVFGSAIAASLAAAVALLVLIPRADVVYATGPGDTRHLALGEGVAVDLAASTRLVAKHGDPGQLELAQGDAYFAVAHDPGRALAIKAGAYTITDIGTTFGVTRSPAAITVAVAEGRLSVTPDRGDTAELAAGQQWSVSPTDGSIRRGVIAATDVASWRQGRLVYDNVPLSIVAPDIARYAGKAVTVDPAIGERRFSGVLAIGDGSKLVANLSDLMAVPYQEDGASARIGARSGAVPAR